MVRRQQGQFGACCNLPSPNAAWHAQPWLGHSLSHPLVQKGEGASVCWAQNVPLQQVFLLRTLLSSLQTASFLIHWGSS